MVIEKLRTNFTDAVTESRLFEVTETSDNQVLVDDVSIYTAYGSYYGAKEINQQHQTVNNLIDNQNFNQGLTTNILDGTTVFDEVDHALNATNTPEADHASTADVADEVDYTPQATTTDLADYAEIADLADLVDYAPNADETPEVDHVGTATSAQFASGAMYATAIGNATINGVTFDGTENITVTDDTKFPASQSFILQAKQALTFTNKVCTIRDSRINSHSLAEVVFTKSCLAEAKKSSIVVDTSSSTLTITAGRTPTQTLYATIYIRVV